MEAIYVAAATAHSHRMQQQQQVVADLSSSHQASPIASSSNPPSSSSLPPKVVNSILLWLYFISFVRQISFYLESQIILHLSFKFRPDFSSFKFRPRCSEYILLHKTIETWLLASTGSCYCNVLYFFSTFFFGSLSRSRFFLTLHECYSI